MSQIALTRLSPPEQPPLFADRLAQLTQTPREAERAAIARALGLDLPAPLSQPERRGPRRRDISQARTVLFARTIPDISGYFWISVVDWH